MTELARSTRLGPTGLAALLTLVTLNGAMAQSASRTTSGDNPAQSQAMAQAPAGHETNEAADPGGWPKISFDTVASLDYARMSSSTGPNRGPGPVLWDDSTFLAEFNDTVSLDGLFQFKPREALASSNPNQDLFINRGLNRKEGGKMKEFYVRYGDWRIGKFVQDFGRGYALLPGPWASDFLEEPEQGYEPSDMVGVEKIHVSGDEEHGWKQLSLSAFMKDRTFLHASFPFNEGIVHYRDGGVGNTRLPENAMATYDVLNAPLGHWGQTTYQASVIRWGKTYGTQRAEWWATLGDDIAIPLRGSVEDTLREHYSQLHLYVEGTRRWDFDGVAGQKRDFLSGSVEYLSGPWMFDLTTTQRWTSDNASLIRKDEIYAGTIAYALPSQTVIALSAAHEKVGEEKGLYIGVRITQAFALCSKCIAKGTRFLGSRSGNDAATSSRKGQPVGHAD